MIPLSSGPYICTKTADENQEELEQFLALFGEWGQDYALLACGLWVPSSNLLAIPPPSHHLYGDPLLRPSLESKGQEPRDQVWPADV